MTPLSFFGWTVSAYRHVDEHPDTDDAASAVWWFLAPIAIALLIVGAI